MFKIASIIDNLTSSYWTRGIQAKTDVPGPIQKPTNKVL